jgi:hypothetical protein
MSTKIDITDTSSVVEVGAALSAVGISAQVQQIFIDIGKLLFEKFNVENESSLIRSLYRPGRAPVSVLNWLGFTPNSL